MRRSLLLAPFIAGAHAYLCPQRRLVTTMAASTGSTSGSGGGKLKVLCLHGFMQTHVTFREKSGSFRKSLKSHCGDWVFCEGPYPAVAAEAGVEAEGDGGEGRSWWRWEDEEGVERPSKAAKYLGVDETLALLRRELNVHRPDALLGFSQGATAAALLLASLAQQQEQQEEQQHVPRLAILAGAFLPRDERWVGLLTASPPQVPTLFLSGEGDQLVPPERTRALMEHFGGSKELLLHPGAHYVPAMKGEMKEQAVAFVERHR